MALRGFPKLEVPRLTAVFFDQVNVVDDHPAVDRLTHIVDRQEGGLNGQEGLNFDSGNMLGFDGGRGRNRVLVVVCKVDIDPG